MTELAQPDVAIIGAGPAGLMAAEQLAGRGHRVTVFDRMASPARKFLLAGRGGLNLTHAEGLGTFLQRYGDAEDVLAPVIRRFPPDALRAWCEGLGEPTFVGSSGRVFPQSFKASPLLRAWLRRLAEAGVTLRSGHQWTGFDDDGTLMFATPEHEVRVTPKAVLLAMGGASWPRLGSDGRWAEVLANDGVAIADLTPANVGFEVPWSSFIKERHAGAPLKRIDLMVAGRSVFGEAVITEEGLEGGVMYAQGAAIRAELARHGTCPIAIDLRPDLPVRILAERLAAPRRKDSFSNVLRKCAGLSPAAAALLREAHPAPANLAPDDLAQLIKRITLSIHGVRAIDKAISTAGGVRWSELNDDLMLERLPGVFCAGEMIDWEAPTGGYLLQACFATGVAAADGIDHWLRAQAPAAASR